MPQSLSAVFVHVVFSTKDRRPDLHSAAIRAELHAYLGGVSATLDCPPLLVGGTEDHVHALVRLGRTVTQADCVKELKRVVAGGLEVGQNGRCEWPRRAGLSACVGPGGG